MQRRCVSNHPYRLPIAVCVSANSVLTYVDAAGVAGAVAARGVHVRQCFAARSASYTCCEMRVVATCLAHLPRLGAAMSCVQIATKMCIFEESIGIRFNMLTLLFVTEQVLLSLSGTHTHDCGLICEQAC